uniref:Mitochondrial import inner membrane translocase subunit Tim21 n=1 Tax=Plectus sambesii TaxID=2011161 RepID=A0A914W376_9BILA
MVLMRGARRFWLVGIEAGGSSRSTNGLPSLSSLLHSRTFSALASLSDGHLRLSSLPPAVSVRTFATPVPRKTTPEDRSVIEQMFEEEPKAPQTVVGKAAEKATNLMLYGFVGIGVVCLAGLTYLLFEEFVSSKSPNKIYGDALRIIRQNDRCVDLLGWPIKAHGEETGRGRRRHVWNTSYEKDGHRRIRVAFHVKGPIAHGVAQVEVEEVLFRFG